MSDVSARESDDQKSRQYRPQSEPASTEASAQTSAIGPGYSRSLLGNDRARSRGNMPVRSSVMQRAQQTYGNRAVQRAIRRASGSTGGAGEPRAVQRFLDGAIDWLTGGGGGAGGDVSAYRGPSIAPLYNPTIGLPKSDAGSKDPARLSFPSPLPFVPHFTWLNMPPA